MSEKKYPIGGYAPGSYHCNCCKCGTFFLGDKRAVECEPCAVTAKEKFDALSPEDQAEVMKMNIEVVNEMFKDWGKKPDVNLVIMGHGKPSLNQDRVIANQVSGMPLEEAIYQDGYSAGVEFEKKRDKTGAVWVKASERLPEQTKKPRLYIVKWFDIQMFVRTWTANQLADWVKNTSSLEYFWLDESGTAAGIEWDSIRLIGRVKDRFKELEEKQHDWRSFYCAWLEGRVDMLQQIKGSGRLFELSQQKADLIREANNRDLAGTAAGREEDACDFAEWMRLNCKSSQNGWVDALGKWDTTKGWYELFKQKEK